MKKILSVLIVFCLLLSSVNVFGLTMIYIDEEGNSVKINDFLDTHHHWAHDQILKWADYEIIIGSNGSFMPDNPIIRGDLSIIIDRMLGLKNITYNYFSDLYSEDYYRESLLKCVAAGYINGIGNNQVNPRGNATREEVAVILCRVFKIDTSYSGSTGFKDDSNISSWARSSIYALNRLGYMNGTPDGKVNPKANITRAEMITLLNNFADTYIPVRDRDNSGSSFVSNFPKNLVLSRSITLNNSIIGRDIYLTQNVSNLSLMNTTVRGRIVCLDRISLTLDKTSVHQIYLSSGKSTIVGVSDLVDEVYVGEYATESTLDTFPNKLVLEPGVRVQVNGIMYENITSRVKTYNGDELRADVSDEQGYVVGGPKIVNGNITLTYDNKLILKDVRVIEGDNEIKEIGIVWLNSDKDEEPINPTYKNNDGRKRYTGPYYEPFTFELEDVEDYCTYRLYVRDRDGLYAYGTPFTLEAYDFSINIDVSEENYPQKLQVDVLFRGKHLPPIRSVQIIYAENDLYSENKNMITLYKYSEQYAENPIDESKYQRYTGIITSQSQWLNGELVYIPPTAFGYIITFGDGNLINRFPVLSNVIPDGVAPVNTLTAGSVAFGENRIIINDSKVVTNLVSVEEVGIAYKESSSSTMSKPSGSTSGWTRISGGRNLDVKETYTFDTIIPITDVRLNTFYVPYVKTSNGYFYGEVSKVENNWLGDEGGPRISNPIVTVLSENTAVIKIEKSFGSVLSLNEDCIVSVNRNSENDSTFDMFSLLDFNCKETEGHLYLYLDNLNKDSSYVFNLLVKDIYGLKSNILPININTNNVVNIVLEPNLSTNRLDFYINIDNSRNHLLGIFMPTTEGSAVIGNTDGYVEVYNDNGKMILYLYNLENVQGTKVSIKFYYTVEKGTKYQQVYSFDRILELY